MNPWQDDGSTSASGGRQVSDRGYSQRFGGRPRLAVDFVAVCDAVRRAWEGNGETVTSIASRFGVSRAWIHKRVYPELMADGIINQDLGFPRQMLVMEAIRAIP